MTGSGLICKVLINDLFLERERPNVEFQLRSLRSSDMYRTTATFCRSSRDVMKHAYYHALHPDTIQGEPALQVCELSDGDIAREIEPGELLYPELRA